jgi:hypothetical protein
MPKTIREVSHRPAKGKTSTFHLRLSQEEFAAVEREVDAHNATNPAVSVSEWMRWAIRQRVEALAAARKGEP